MTVKGRLQSPPTVRMGGDSIGPFRGHSAGVVIDDRLSFAQHALTQRPALTLLTKAYRTTSTAALPVLAGVLPADLDVILAGRVDSERDYLTGAEVGALRRVREEVMDDWQRRWDEERMVGSCSLLPERIGGLEVLQVGPVYYADLVGSQRTSAGLEICACLAQIARRTAVKQEEEDCSAAKTVLWRYKPY
ncbi:hypothetical protein EVAR_7589_1 [Eumeta japonica]|uniref:Uncharacterized protein n=1 Tax=Eumeta variegata TaxID=151549 RepID=A0A4C2A6J1_EUMVA|nr:hypothetical protein EVAR_7589_1 [Eumeta japonica]